MCHPWMDLLSCLVTNMLWAICQIWLGVGGADTGQSSCSSVPGRMWRQGTKTIRHASNPLHFCQYVCVYGEKRFGLLYTVNSCCSDQCNPAMCMPNFDQTVRKLTRETARLPSTSRPIFRRFLATSAGANSRATAQKLSTYSWQQVAPQTLNHKPQTLDSKEMPRRTHYTQLCVYIYCIYVIPNA